MRCMLCHERGVFERTVFNGTQPTTVRLCRPCAERVNAIEHLEKIRTADNHAAKTDAVTEFLTVLGK